MEQVKEGKLEVLSTKAGYDVATGVLDVNMIVKSFEPVERLVLTIDYV